MASPRIGAPQLTNLYHLRTVGTEKSCSMCGKATFACLATPDVSDFIYTCTSHLADPGFAKPFSTSTTSESTTTASSKSTSSPAPALQSEIAKVKAEYEAKLAAKDKALANAASENKSSSSWLQSGLKTGYSAVSSLATTTIATINSPMSPPPTPPPSQSELNKAIAMNSKVFILHRSIFAMRQDAVKKKWQAQEARERAKGLGLPSVPVSRP